MCPFGSFEEQRKKQKNKFSIHSTKYLTLKDNKKRPSMKQKENKLSASHSH